MALCLTMNVSAMAAEVEAVSVKKDTIVEDTQPASVNAETVGSVVFYLKGNQTQLPSSGTETVRLTKQPTWLTYRVLAKNGGNASVTLILNGHTIWVSNKNQSEPINILQYALPTDRSIEIEYKGASTALVSISLVFSK